MMGHALGLYVKETTFKEVYISDQPMPPDLLQLNWQWESKGNLTKPMGIFIGDDISPTTMVQSLMEELETRLAKA